MGLSLSRVLAIGGLAAAAAGVLIAVSRGLQAATTVTSGVAAAEAVQAKPVHHTVRIDGATIRVTKKPTGSVCYSAPHGVSDCASSLGAEQVSYASGHAGKRLVVAGVAGAHVKAVIVRLTRKGTVWPRLRNGAFYAVLPRGYRPVSIVKVLAGGRRVVLKA